MRKTPAHIVIFRDERRAEFEDDQREIDFIRFTVHTTGQMGKSLRSHNHVTTNLILKNGLGSVRINMHLAELTFPEMEGLPFGVLELQSFEYTSSKSQVHEHDVPLARKDMSLTVAMVYRALRYEWASYRYSFSGGGSGCRYWASEVAEKMAQKDWIASDLIESLQTALSYQYSRNVPAVKCDDPTGSFMTEEEWNEAWFGDSSDL